MGRQNADDRDACARCRAPGERELEPVGARARDDVAVVEDRVHALAREQRAEALHVVGGRRPAEVVADAAERGAVLLERSRTARTR